MKTQIYGQKMLPQQLLAPNNLYAFNLMHLNIIIFKCIFYYC